MPVIDFYFDYRSPYSYLANSELQRLPVQIAYHPFDIRNLMQQVGNVPTTITCKAKGQYARVDLQRWVKHYQIPYQRNAKMNEIDFLRLLRVTILAIEQDVAAAVVNTLFQTIWSTDHALATIEDITTVLSGTALDPQLLAQKADDKAWDKKLNEATAEAVERGVFGAPTVFLGTEMYFGNDRLHFIRNQLEEAA